MKNVAFIRHLDDIEDLKSPDRDAGIDHTKNTHSPIQAEIISNAVTEIKPKRIITYTSATKRTKQTIQLILEILKKNNPTITFEEYEDKRLNTLFHGSPKLPDGYKSGDKFPLDRKAYDYWIEQNILNKNIYYKFGDPICKGEICLYNDLKNAYYALGESRADFITRIYTFILDFLAKKYDNNDNFYLICSHMPSIMEFCAVLKFANKVCISEKKEIQNGLLRNLKWDSDVEKVVFDPPHIYVTSFENIEKIKDAIRSELNEINKISSIN